MADTEEECVQASDRESYAESLIVKDLIQVSVFDQGELCQSQESQIKSPHHSLSKSFKTKESTETNSESTVTNDSLSLQKKLRERLYDKPENSEVMQYIRLQTMKKGQEPWDNSMVPKLTPLNKNIGFEHLPTTKSKRSLASHPDHAKSSKELSNQEIAILQNIVYRKRHNQIFQVNSSQDHRANITEAEKLDSDSRHVRNRDDTKKCKSVNISSGVPLQLSLGKSVECAFKGKMHNDLECIEVTSRIQSPAKKIEEPTSREQPEKVLVRSRSAGVKSSSDASNIKHSMKSQSTSNVPSKTEAGRDQSYSNKMKYDDKVPENKNAYEKLIEMRKKLGWVVNIPRHGPATRENMEKLKDIPETLNVEKDSGEFSYCLPRNHGNLRARYDPYDLQIVSANTALSESMYFTISASYVTMCYESENEMNESSTTPALWWLWERRLFYKVFRLPFFVKFRLWKSYKQLKEAVQRQRNKRQQTKLYRSLFIANEVLQGCLVHVRSLCECARNVFKDGDTRNIISLVELDPSVTMTLKEFEGLQKTRCDRALKQLMSLREKIVEIVYESCTTVAEMEGITQGIRDEKDQNVNLKPLPVKESSPKQSNNLPNEEGKEKVKKPLYVEIAEWRKILARLSCFLQCVDYILQDLLRQLVFSAVEKLGDHLVTSYHAEEYEEANKESDDVDIQTGKLLTPLNIMSSRSSKTRVSSNMSAQSGNKQKQNKVQKESDQSAIPHYDFDKVEVTERPLNIDQILDEIKQQDVVEEVINPVFTVSLVLNVSSSSSLKSLQFVSMDTEKTTDALTESESEYESNSEKDDENQPHMDSENKEKYAYPAVLKEELTHLKSFVSLSPSATEFHSSIYSLICYFEDTVIKVTPMLREPKLAVFYTSPKHDLHLKTDEEKVEEKSEVVQCWPDLDLILRDDPLYQKLLSDILDYMEMEMKLLYKFTKSYNIYCQMVDQSLRMKVEDSIAKKPWTSDEFNKVLHTYTKMIQRMNKMVTSQRVAMVQVHALEFKKSCLPYPQAVSDAAKNCLPTIASKRNEDLMTIIKGASKLLDKTILNVEEFVEHLSLLGRMSLELPALEKELDFVNKLFAVGQDYNISFNLEQMALYQTLSPSFQHLKSSTIYCEAKKDENIRKFTSQLDTLITNIRSSLISLKSRVHDPELLHAETHGPSALETITLLQEEMETLSLKAHSYSSYQERFGSSLSKQRKSYYGVILSSDQKFDNNIQEVERDLHEIERDLNLRGLLWQSFEEWTKLVSEWTTTSFDDVNVEEVQKTVNKLTQTILMLEKGLPHNEVVPKLKEMVIDFKQGMPVITSLCNPCLKQHHWDEIQKTIKRIINHDKDFTLGNLLDMNIFKHKEKIQEISMVASNETALQQMLQKVISLWQSTDLSLVPHAERDTMIISGADDILAQLEESQVTIATIKGSRYVTAIKPRVEEWERKLQILVRTLEEWLTCQRNWLYLEQIFSTPDIQKQLPTEYKLFIAVDTAWKDIMRRTAKSPNVLKSALTHGTLDTLQMCNNNLEKVQKCLEDYLETKRFIFPRFYFLSNEELLDILAQSKDPNAVQPHLLKCFDNIKNLDIQILPRQPPTVRSMISSEKETVAMPRNVRARGAVEQWLGTVETGMFETVKKHMKLGLADKHITNLKDWVLKQPGQVVLTVTQIMFNKEVTKSLESSDPSLALSKIKEQMVDILNQLASLTSASLYAYQRMSIEALLTIAVHNRDIITELIKRKVRKKEDFEWNRQLRYEWDECINNCLVLQSNGIFQYGYEYLGCSARLVITPLTDRCYLTLTGALHLHLGGSPAGPAGTGKTETVKDLAKAMGKQCVVFNCSEGLDYKMLGKFFSGLGQSGSWCCFDEFNRIDVEVLSVVAMQIHSIKAAKDSQSSRFMFEGRDIKLNPTCGFFITMNPTYAGRVELPDNLKYLFRPVTMMVPDYALIAEIMLFSEGFLAAKSLSQKIVNLYQLASKQLSQQDHYDFGMRAIKSILVMAGHGRRSALQRHSSGVNDITESEEAYILIHSLRDVNMPKFLAEDVPLFESILDDLFPGVIPPSQDHAALEKAISMSIKELNLQQWPNQIEKVKHLYNQILVRHGVMLVGPTGGGKTTIRNILQKALVHLPTILSQTNREFDQKNLNGRRQSVLNTSKSDKGHVETFFVNPKCVSLGELYGETNPNTFEWSDGLIGNASRKFSRDLMSAQNSAKNGESTARTGASNLPGTEKESSTDVHAKNYKEIKDDKEGRTITEWRWIILDGPVDTLWVENLNTVLDDSKVLCLTNGERISLAEGMRFLFEVDNLSEASPATVSRCAMVYMDPVDLGWKPYARTWLDHLTRELPESGKEYLQALFDASVDKGLYFLNKYKQHQALNAPDLSIIGTLCHILSAYIDFIGSHGGFGKPDEREKDTNQVAEDDGLTCSKGETSKIIKNHPLKNSLKIREDGDNKDFLSGTHSGWQEKKVFFLEKNPTQLTNLLGKLFVFAYTWSFGSVLKRREFMEEEDSNIKKAGTIVDKVDMNNEFDNFVHELFDVEPPLGVRLPAGNKSIYGYFVDMEGGGFVPWDVLVPSTRSLIERGVVITIGKKLGMSSDKRKGETKEAEIIPTVDIVRFSFLISLLLVNKHPVLLTGESGVGKSAIVTHMLKRLEQETGTSTEKPSTILGAVLQYSEKQLGLLEDISSLTSFHHDDDDNSEDSTAIEMLMGSKSKNIAVISTMIQCSAQTTSKRLETQIMLKLIKKNKTAMRAPKGKKVIVFVDDLNMPASEKYGTQPPLELFRQFLEMGGFYDTKKLVWKDIQDVTIVAACGPPYGGRNPTTPRLLKHFSLFTLPQPSTKSLQHIYQVQLGRFLQEGEFMPEVQDCLFPLVSASIALYNHICVAMLPTPTKSHYTFNIRDLSKVIQGMLQVHESVIVGKENCVQLFAHEATRIFHDRLINTTDRATFFEILSDTLHCYFKVRWSAKKLMSESPVFGDFFDSVDHTSSHKLYKPLSDTNRLLRILEEHHMRLHMGETTDQLVFFKEAAEHVVRAARVFRQPRGHLLLVGIDGTGKSTVINLASYISNCAIFRLNLHNQYGIQDFKDDIKSLLLQAGVKDVPTVFLLTDSDIVKECFLEEINCILNSGEVPDLFDSEELDGITMDIKGAAIDAGFSDAKASIYNFFIHKIRQNLHVVLAMSPAGDRFRHRCRMNPALINCCTIDWFDEWSDEAMLGVAKVFFTNTEFIADENRYYLEELKEHTAQTCVNIHKSISFMSQRYREETKWYYYSTPSSYMELLQLFSHMLGDNKLEFTNNRNHLQNGLSALSNAYAMVGVMQEELVSLGPVITAKAKVTEELLKELEEDQQAVKEVEDMIVQEENIMARETQIVQDYANECESDLASVLPVLHDAIAALETLDKASISELRVYTNPPQLVATVVAAVCVLFQKKTDWATGKLFLGDPQFLKLLFNYDRDSQPEKVYIKLKKYTKDPNFNPEAVGKVSLACKCICSWVLAIDNYNTVHKMVKPKQKKVLDAREALKLAQDNLAKKQESLRKIQDHLGVIQQHYQDSVSERESLKERQKVTELRLQRASILISALADEEVRWSQSVKILDRKLEGIVGDTLIAAASVVYLGAYTSYYRNQLVDNWVNLCIDSDIPISKDFDLVRSLADANQVMEWYNNGLPRDRLSTENATFVLRARKWPLFVDPQGQALRWIKEKEGKQLKIVAGTDVNIMRTVETAIKVGAACLLVDVGEELNPGLRPVLLQETFSKGGQQFMKIGDAELEYNNNFRLYLTTSLANPHYLPGAYLLVNIINFTVTFDGLQEQLLSSVVKQERPTLEKQRTELLESIATDKQSLRDLEDKTLSMLQSTEGHLLDDQDLVETLQQSKIISQEIHKRVAKSEETEQSLNLARRRYLPVTTRGAVVYFVISKLANLDVMYQYSLTWFKSMFSTCIRESVVDISSSSFSKTLAVGIMRPTSARQIKSMHNDVDKEAPSKLTETGEDEGTYDLKKHLQRMTERLTHTIYRIVSIGLFSHHQLIFSFLLCSSIMQSKVSYEDGTQGIEVIQEKEWHIFLHGNTSSQLIRNKTDIEVNGDAAEELQQQKDLMQGDDTKESHNKKTGKFSLAKQKLYPSWITESTWQQCQYLEATFSHFHHLCQSLSTCQKQWSDFKTSEEPFAFMEKTFMPEPGANQSEIIFEWFKLTKFQRLLLIKTLRFDVLPVAMAQFIQDQLGSKYLATGAFDLHEIYNESMAKSPLIFILSSGCDPSSHLMRFAKRLRENTSHVDMISLGRGQGPKAEELISKAQILKGRWVFLQNCHLAASWMPRLQNIVEKFNQSSEDSLDPQFRLWLSSMPDPSFPVSILQSGIKMTIEAPRGLKANMLRTFGSSEAGVVTRKLYDEGSTKLEWRPLLFGLCLFNSVVHERRKYGTQGWNIKYEFNDSDLEVSILKLQMLLEEHDDIPWEALSYLTSEVTYGGRVTDDWDRRCLKFLLGKFYSPAVFKPGFCYDSHQVYLPVTETMNFDSLITFVKELPNNDSPEVFGMTENAEKSCREIQATEIINTICSVQPRRFTNLSRSQKSSDSMLEMAGNISKLLPHCVEDSSPVCDSSLMEPQRSLKSILQKDIEMRGLNNEKLQILQTLTNNMAGNSALLTVLRQEVDRFNHLLSVIHTSLSSLIQAVKGEIVMSEQLEEACEALLSYRVPSQWKAAAYESTKPLSSWVTDLQQRVKFFADWTKLLSSTLEKKFRQVVRNLKEANGDAGAVGIVQPSCFWLSAFFFPQGFLTAVLQNHARKMSVSVDSLTFRFEVMIATKETDTEENSSSDNLEVHDVKKTRPPPENGILINGLFLDGACWDTQTNLLQNCSTDQRFYHLPEIHFEPVEHSKTAPAAIQGQPFDTHPNHDNGQKVYICPLYRTSARAGTLSSTGHSTNFVTSVNLPSDKPPDFWILRGVAMLCQCDD